MHTGFFLRTAKPVRVSTTRMYTLYHGLCACLCKAAGSALLWQATTSERAAFFLSTQTQINSPQPQSQCPWPSRPPKALPLGPHCRSSDSCNQLRFMTLAFFLSFHIWVLSRAESLSLLTGSWSLDLPPAEFKCPAWQSPVHVTQQFRNPRLGDCDQTQLSVKRDEFEENFNLGSARKCKKQMRGSTKNLSRFETSETVFSLPQW